MIFTEKYIKKVIKNKYLARILFFLQYPCFVILAIPCYLPLVNQIIETIARCWSVGTIGFFLRAVYYKTKLTMGKDVFIDCGVTINNPKDVWIGNEVYIDENVTIRTTGGFLFLHDCVRIAANTYIQAGGGITFYEESATSSRCNIYSQTHYYEKEGKVVGQCSMLPDEKQNIIKSHIIIGIGALLGVGVSLLPGAIIGEYTTIGAHAMVNSEIEPYSIAVGCPAKVIKRLECSNT